METAEPETCPANYRTTPTTLQIGVVRIGGYTYSNIPVRQTCNKSVSRRLLISLLGHQVSKHN